MVSEMSEHPEQRGAPLISAAVESIMVDAFRDELRFGQHDYEDGTHNSYMEDSKRILTEIKASKDLTWAGLLLMQAYECAGKEDAAELRVALTSLGGTVVQWIEALDAKHGAGV